VLELLGGTSIGSGSTPKLGIGSATVIYQLAAGNTITLQSGTNSTEVTLSGDSGCRVTIVKLN
jgi:hypothetical protein